MSLASQVPLNVENVVASASAESHSRDLLLSLIGLAAGILALGLAAVPSIVMERPIPNPFETPAEAQRRIDGPPLRQGGVAFKIKGIEIRFGGKEIKNPAAPPNLAPPPKPAVTSDPVRWFMIAACLCGFTGIAVSAVAQVREKHTVMTCTAMSCSIAAITWQFLVIGIMLGVAAAIFLLIMKIFL